MAIINLGLFMTRVATINVAAGAREQAITFSGPANLDYVVKATTSWNTTAWDEEADRTTTATIVRFGTAAPSGGGKLRVIIEFF